ncbi:MAG: transporter substrate-binding domain-containing protein [Psychrosphaera sp.]|nr:transporter substrate-binding domain-containing protein [Psychrosphaera sp.]
MNKFLPLMLISLLCFSNNSCADKVRFVTEYFEPLQITNKSGQLDGMAVELVRALCAKAGIEANISVYPWARAYRMALTQPNTFIFSIAKTEARLPLFKWVGAYYWDVDAFYSLASRKDIVINSIDDAKKYRIAVPRGDVGVSRLAPFGFDASHFELVANQQQSLWMLVKGRVDLNTNNERGFATLIKNLGLNRADFKNSYEISKTSLWLAASLDTPDALIDKMRKAMNELKTDGTHARLMKKWLPELTVK